MPSIWQCFTWRHFGIDSLDFQRLFWTRVDATNLGNLPAFTRNACPPFQRCGLGDGLRGWFDMYWHVWHPCHASPRFREIDCKTCSSLRDIRDSSFACQSSPGHGGTPVHLVFGETQALNSDHQPQMMDIGYRLDSNCSITAPPSCLSLSQGDASPAGTNDLGYPLGIEHGWEVSYGIFEGKYGEWSN